MKTILSTAALTTLVCLHPIQSQAAPVGSLIKALSNALSGATPLSRALPPSNTTRASEIDQLVDALRHLPPDQQPNKVDVENAYLMLLRRAGVDQTIAIACPACVANPRLPDEAERSARVMLREDRFLSARMAGTSYGGALSSHRSNGALISGTSAPHKFFRHDTQNALTSALNGARDPDLDPNLTEPAFRQMIEDGLLGLTTETPEKVKKRGFTSIEYDADKHSLSFSAEFRGTEITVSNLDIKRYIDRGIGLVFGSGGVYLLHPDANDPDPDDPAANALNQKVSELAQARNACWDAMSVACLGQAMDPNISEDLKTLVWADALLEETARRAKVSP
jgi:hypothetical protein